MYSHASHAHASLLKLFKHAFIMDTPAFVLMLFLREKSINIRTPQKMVGHIQNLLSKTML